MQMNERQIPDLVIGIVGPERAGKSTAARIFEIVFRDRGVCTVNGGEILEWLLREIDHPTPTARSAKQKIYSAVKNLLEDERWLVEIIERRLQRSGRRIWILNGLRLPCDVAFVQRFPRWNIFYVDVSFRIRLERARRAARKRGGKTDEAHLTPAEFVKIQSHETSGFVERIKSIQGVTVLKNDRTVRNLGAEIVSTLLNEHLVTPEQLFSSHQALEAFYRQFD